MVNVCRIVLKHHPRAMAVVWNLGAWLPNVRIVYVVPGPLERVHLFFDLFFPSKVPIRLHEMAAR